MTHFRQLLLELKCQFENPNKSKNRRVQTKKIFNKLFNYFNSEGCLLDENSLISKKEQKLYSKIYDKDNMLEFIKNKNILNELEEFKLLCQEIEKGRGSIASFCYERIRCQAIHESAPSDNWVIGDKEISFDELYTALNNIYQCIKKEYEETGKFLGYKGEDHDFSK